MKEVIEPTVASFEDMIELKPSHNEKWELLDNICPDVVPKYRNSRYQDPEYDYTIFFRGYINTAQKTIAESVLCQYNKYIGRPMTSDINLNIL